MHNPLENTREKTHSLRTCNETRRSCFMKKKNRRSKFSWDCLFLRQIIIYDLLHLHRILLEPTAFEVVIRRIWYLASSDYLAACNISIYINYFYEAWHIFLYINCISFKGTGTRDSIWLKVVSLDRSWLVGLTDDLV